MIPEKHVRRRPQMAVSNGHGAKPDAIREKAIDGTAFRAHGSSRGGERGRQRTGPCGNSSLRTTKFQAEYDAGAGGDVRGGNQSTSGAHDEGRRHVRGLTDSEEHPAVGLAQREL